MLFNAWKYVILGRLGGPQNFANKGIPVKNSGSGVLGSKPKDFRANTRYMEGIWIFGLCGRAQRRCESRP